jgi:hypothetical protein
MSSPEAVFERAPVPQVGPEADALVALPNSLPPPDDEEVERLLRMVAPRVVGLLRKQGKLDNVSCEGVLDSLLGRRSSGSHWERSAHRRSRSGGAPSWRGSRCTRTLGCTRMTATTSAASARTVPAGRSSLERLSRLPDGRLAYRMKRPAASGQTELVLEPVEFLRRLAALVPPPRVNLVRFFGFFAPNASLRRHLVPPSRPSRTRPCPSRPARPRLRPPITAFHGPNCSRQPSQQTS